MVFPNSHGTSICSAACNLIYIDAGCTVSTGETCSSSQMSNVVLVLEEGEDDLFLFFEIQCFCCAISAVLSVSGVDGTRPL